MIPLIVFLIGGFGGGLLVFYQFKWLSQSKFGKNMFVHATSGAVKKEKPLQELVGKSGHAETDHHPEGLVRVDNKTYDSFCSSGFLSKGAEVEIIEADAFRLIVRPL